MELVTTGTQTIQPNEDVLFQAMSVPGSQSIIWRQGSGILTLRGLFNRQPRARFKVNFGANVALDTGATVEPITLAIAVNGETLTPSRMIVTPVDVEEYWNIFREIYIDVPTGCCTQITVKNLGAQPIALQDGNLIAERVA